MASGRGPSVVSKKKSGKNMTGNAPNQFLDEHNLTASTEIFVINNDSDAISLGWENDLIDEVLGPHGRHSDSIEQPKLSNSIFVPRVTEVGANDIMIEDLRPSDYYKEDRYYLCSRMVDQMYGYELTNTDLVALKSIRSSLAPTTSQSILEDAMERAITLMEDFTFSIAVTQYQSKLLKNDALKRRMSRQTSSGGVAGSGARLSGQKKIAKGQSHSSNRSNPTSASNTPAFTTLTPTIHPKRGSSSTLPIGSGSISLPPTGPVGTTMAGVLIRPSNLSSSPANQRTSNLSQMNSLLPVSFQGDDIEDHSTSSIPMTLPTSSPMAIFSAPEGKSVDSIVSQLHRGGRILQTSNTKNPITPDEESIMPSSLSTHNSKNQSVLMDEPSQGNGNISVLRTHFSSSVESTHHQSQKDKNVLSMSYSSDTATGGNGTANIALAKNENRIMLASSCASAALAAQAISDDDENVDIDVEDDEVDNDDFDDDFEMNEREESDNLDMILSENERKNEHDNNIISSTSSSITNNHGGVVRRRIGNHLGGVDDKEDDPTALVCDCQLSSSTDSSSGSLSVSGRILSARRRKLLQEDKGHTSNNSFSRQKHQFQSKNDNHQILISESKRTGITINESIKHICKKNGKGDVVFVVKLEDKVENSSLNSSQTTPSGRKRLRTIGTDDEPSHNFEDADDGRGKIIRVIEGRDIMLKDEDLESHGSSHRVVGGGDTCSLDIVDSVDLLLKNVINKDSGSGSEVSGASGNNQLNMSILQHQTGNMKLSPQAAADVVEAVRMQSQRLLKRESPPLSLQSSVCVSPSNGSRTISPIGHHQHSQLTGNVIQNVCSLSSSSSSALRRLTVLKRASLLHQQQLQQQQTQLGSDLSPPPPQHISVNNLSGDIPLNVITNNKTSPSQNPAHKYQLQNNNIIDSALLSSSSFPTSLEIVLNSSNSSSMPRPQDQHHHHHRLDDSLTTYNPAGLSLMDLPHFYSMNTICNNLADEDLDNNQSNNNLVGDDEEISMSESKPPPAVSKSASQVTTTSNLRIKIPLYGHPTPQPSPRFSLPDMSPMTEVTPLIPSFNNSLGGDNNNSNNNSKNPSTTNPNASGSPLYTPSIPTAPYEHFAGSHPQPPPLNQSWFVSAPYALRGGREISKTMPLPSEERLMDLMDNDETLKGMTTVEIRKRFYQHWKSRRESIKHPLKRSYWPLPTSSWLFKSKNTPLKPDQDDAFMQNHAARVRKSTRMLLARGPSGSLTGGYGSGGGPLYDLEVPSSPRQDGSFAVDLSPAMKVGRSPSLGGASGTGGTVASTTGARTSTSKSRNGGRLGRPPLPPTAARLAQLEMQKIMRHLSSATNSNPNLQLIHQQHLNQQQASFGGSGTLISGGIANNNSLLGNAQWGGCGRSGTADEPLIEVGVFDLIAHISSEDSVYSTVKSNNNFDGNQTEIDDIPVASNIPLEGTTINPKVNVETTTNANPVSNSASDEIKTVDNSSSNRFPIPPCKDFRRLLAHAYAPAKPTAKMGLNAYGVWHPISDIPPRANELLNVSLTFTANGYEAFRFLSKMSAMTNTNDAEMQLYKQRCESLCFNCQRKSQEESTLMLQRTGPSIQVVNSTTTQNINSVKTEEEPKPEPQSKTASDLAPPLGVPPSTNSKSTSVAQNPVPPAPPSVPFGVVPCCRCGELAPGPEDFAWHEDSCRGSIANGSEGEDGPGENLPLPQDEPSAYLLELALLGMSVNSGQVDPSVLASYPRRFRRTRRRFGGSGAGGVENGTGAEIPSNSRSSGVIQSSGGSLNHLHSSGCNPSSSVGGGGGGGMSSSGMDDQGDDSDGGGSNLEGGDLYGMNSNHRLSKNRRSRQMGIGAGQSSSNAAGNGTNTSVAANEKVGGMSVVLSKLQRVVNNNNSHSHGKFNGE